MARPTKYTPELTKRIRQYISDGLNIRDVCFGVGISEDTFCRWRRTKPEFAKLVDEATEAQTWSSLALARTSEYRRYTRRQKAYKTRQKQPNTHLETQNSLKTAIDALQGYLIGGGIELKTRTSPPTNDFGELVCCDPYYNATTDRIEWAEREIYGYPVFHSCQLDTWQDKILPKIKE